MQTAIQFGKGDLAKYPFLSEAGNYLRELDYTLDEFNDSIRKCLYTEHLNAYPVALITISSKHLRIWILK
jgi:hypothetical protein